MLEITRPEVLNLSAFSFRRVSFGVAALLVTASLDPKAVLAAIEARNTLWMNPNPQYLVDFPTLVRPSENFTGLLAALTQTVQRGQSGLTATLKFDGSVRALRSNGVTSTYARLRDLLANGQFANNPLGLEATAKPRALYPIRG